MTIESEEITAVMAMDDEPKVDPVDSKPEPKPEEKPAKEEVQEPSDTEKRISDLERELALYKQKDAVQTDLLMSAKRIPTTEEEEEPKVDVVGQITEKINAKMDESDSYMREATKIRREASEADDPSKLDDAVELELKAKRLDLEVIDLKNEKHRKELESKTTELSSKEIIQKQIVEVSNEYTDLLCSEHPEFTTTVDGETYINEEIFEFVTKAEEHVINDLVSKGYINKSTPITEFLLNRGFRDMVAEKVKSNPIVSTYLKSITSKPADDDKESRVPLAESGGSTSSPSGDKSPGISAAAKAMGFGDED